MQKKINLEKKCISTNDKIIRKELKERIKNIYNSSPVRIIEELFLEDGATRIDIAVVNGILHGYEIKSDLDTLVRLPKQMSAYNSVFDKITLVVGEQHLHESFRLIPDWWGVLIAKTNQENGMVYFNEVREASENPHQEKISIVKLLWKNEALELLDSIGGAYGYRTKTKDIIHERISNVLDLNTIKTKVRKTLLLSRSNWRVETAPMLNGD